jgi:hypothetical protein
MRMPRNEGLLRPEPQKALIFWDSPLPVPGKRGSRGDEKVFLF